MVKRSNRTAPMHLTENTFDEVVAASDGLLMVDFSDWCAPCHAMAPILEDLGANSGGRVILAKVNVDETPGLADRYGIRAIPTVLLFRGAPRGNDRRIDSVRPSRAPRRRAA